MALPDPVDPEVLIARKAWGSSQDGFIAMNLQPTVIPGGMVTGWHDTNVEEERGATAVVDENDEVAAALVGEILRVSVGHHSALIYVIDSSNILPTPLSLSRRAFAAIAPLWYEQITPRVEVME